MIQLFEDLHMKILKDKKINMMAILLFSLFNSGCGGGGSSDSVDNSVSESINATVPAVDSTPEVIVNTGDLISEKDFLFNSTGSLDIDVNIKSLEYTRAYINICYVNDDLNIDYQNCVVNAPLKNGRMQSEIELANDVELLYMAVWQYGIDETPLSAVWQRTDGMTWNVIL